MRGTPCNIAFTRKPRADDGQHWALGKGSFFRMAGFRGPIRLY